MPPYEFIFSDIVGMANFDRSIKAISRSAMAGLRIQAGCRRLDPVLEFRHERLTL